MSSTTSSTLFSPPPTASGARTRIRINDDVYVDEEDDLCVVWVHGSPWHRFAASNKVDRRIVGASLVVGGLARSAEVERGLGINHDTLYRDRKRIVEGGIPAIAALKSGPKGPTRATPALKARARRHWCAGKSKRAIARKLGVSEGTVRRLLKGVKSPEPVPVQQLLLPKPGEPEIEAEESAAPLSTDVVDEQQEAGAAVGGAEVVDQGTAASEEAKIEDFSAFLPAAPHPQETTAEDLDRTEERALASCGRIAEANVRYVSGEDLRFVGALLILPALVATGFFAGVEEVYGKLKNGFYGLRHTVMTVALMFTLRIKRAEHLTSVSPTALGRLLGLDRVPEVKTLRRRLREIARRNKADEFMRWFAKHLAEENFDALGFLYVDGHTRVYYGKRKVSKAYSTRKRLALPAVTDYWVHDADGQPIFVVTGEVNQALTKQLLPLVEDLKGLLPPGQRLTFLFDRGGWSPKLFKKLVQAGCDFVTYRKGKYRRYPVKDFTEASFQAGEKKLSYMLRDGLARFGVGMQFREIVRRESDGHQISIVTSRKDVPAAEVVFRLGARWRQENFFKYAREEFDLDALDTYDVEAEDPNRTVPNPKRKTFDKKIKALRKEIQGLEAKLGRAADANEESCRPTVRGFKIAHGSLRQKLAKVRDELGVLVERRKQLPVRVTIAEATADEGVLLEVEHKHFMNAVKMAVYRAESSLFRILAPHYKRSEDEGRALLREAFTSSGSLHVENDELCVTLHPMSAPRRTRAVAALCEQLNRARVRIPGTTLRLRFAVSRETGVSEMAMGPCQEV